MAELTGQEIVSQVAQRLRNRFSVKEFVEIYKDKPVQAMKTPCIFIHSIDTSYKPQLRGYGMWEEMLDIRCHPGQMQTNVFTWARTVAPMILDCVYALTVSQQQVKAREASWKVEDGVLHVLVSYYYRVLRPQEEVPDMQTLIYGERLKD